MPARKFKTINHVAACNWPHCRSIATDSTEQEVAYCPRHYRSVQRNRVYIRELYELKYGLAPLYGREK